MLYIKLTSKEERRTEAESDEKQKRNTLSVHSALEERKRFFLATIIFQELNPYEIIPCYAAVKYHGVLKQVNHGKIVLKQVNRRLPYITVLDIK